MQSRPRANRRLFLNTSVRLAGGALLICTFPGCGDEKVSKLRLQLLRPQGGEQWIAGEVLNIEWVSEGIRLLHIEFSPDDGNSWQRLFENVPAEQGQVGWSLPELPSQTCLIRLLAAEPECMEAQHRNPFSLVLPDLQLIAPEPGMLFNPGDEHPIIWSAIGVERVDIDFSPDDGASWSQVAKSVPAEDGRYLWTAPEVESLACKLRIRESGEDQPAFVQEVSFSIRHHLILSLADYPALQSPTTDYLILAEPTMPDVAVRREEEHQFSALSLVCPHAACTVDWRPADGVFSCPCHLSIFDSRGCHVFGAAGQALWSLDTEYLPETDELILFLNEQANASC